MITHVQHQSMIRGCLVCIPISPHVRVIYLVFFSTQFSKISPPYKGMNGLSRILLFVFVTHDKHGQCGRVVRPTLKVAEVRVTCPLFVEFLPVPLTD